MNKNNLEDVDVSISLVKIKSAHPDIYFILEKYSYELKKLTIKFDEMIKNIISLLIESNDDMTALIDEKINILINKNKGDL